MFVTIAVCTFNRSRLLDETLREMRHLDVPGSTEWEIVVVNNNCTDDTDAVIQRYAEDLPIRRLWEGRPGKSHAANLAVREARGELILWTDDDVLVDSGWLRAYAEAARAFPDVSFFGGPIAPWFESEPPAWITRHLHVNLISVCFAMRDGFDKPFVPIIAPRLPYGANMATRVRCFERCSFDVRLGPRPHSEVRGEEIALLESLLDRGLAGLWVREARVRHFIPSVRLTERYLWEYHCGIGRTQVRRGDVAATKKILRVPRWLLRQYVENLAVSTLLSPTKNVRWLRALTRAAVSRGMIGEFRDQGIAGQDDERYSSRRDNRADVGADSGPATVGTTRDWPEIEISRCK